MLRIEGVQACGDFARASWRRERPKPAIMAHARECKGDELCAVRPQCEEGLQLHDVRAAQYERSARPRVSRVGLAHAA